MDWQTPLTILLAAACAAFLLRGWLRPFISRAAGACGGCRGRGETAGGEGSGDSGLVQIDGAPSPGRADGAPR